MVEKRNSKMHFPIGKSYHLFGAAFIFILLSLVFSFCNRSSSSSWKNEPLEPKRFAKVKLADDFDEPMEMAVLPGGKVLVVERKGVVKLFSPATGLCRPIATIPVYSGQEDGLLGVTLDPEFADNQFLYFYYSPNDSIPRQRVSRFVFRNDSLLSSSEKIVIEIPTQRQECCHSAGSLAFGPDGNLYIAVGDNTNPHNPGYYNSIDERKGREAWDAQRTAANTNDFRGKVLRIKPRPDGGYTVPAGNLFPAGTPNTKPEIYAMGCRNPFRISVDRKRGWLYWGDVGQNTIDDPKRGPISYDEWNLATGPGFFGWPYFAGPNAAYADFDFATEKIGDFFNASQPLNASVNNTGLKNLPPAKEALIWYSYDESKDFKYLGTGGKSPIAGPVYYSSFYDEKANDTSRQLPTYYDGKLFIAEWMRNWVNVVTLKENGKVDSIEQFMPETVFNHPIDLEIGPEGALYVLEYGTYWFARNKDAGLYRIEYNRGNRAPVVTVGADKTTGGLPFRVQFSSKGSYDQDSSQLSYKWYFEKAEVQSTEANPAYIFQRAGTYNVRLVVADKEGKSSEKTITVKVGNALPEISLETNSNKTFFWSRQPIHYRINVTDQEDGSLASGGILPEQVKVTLSNNAMGSDLTMVAQGHEAAANHPGAALIEKSDCKSCHALNDKSVGPAYTAIAERYKKDAATIKKLSAKVIAGGSGNWGEHAMSAHPQLTATQASAMVSYILSVKDEKNNTVTQSPVGVINPTTQAGEFILAVTYQDRERMGVGANIAKKNFHFRAPRLKAAASGDDKGVAKLSESVVRFTESGSWLLFKQIDLTGLNRVSFFADSRQIGGRLSLRLDKPDGKEVASVQLKQQKGPTKTGADKKDEGWTTVFTSITKETGTHDLYIVYEDPANAKSDIWTSLFLRWIEFHK